MNAATTRAGAWRELAGWITDGIVPDAVEIGFNPLSKTALSVDVDTPEAFDAWCKMLRFSYSKPTVDTYDDVVVTHWWDYWNGWHASVTLRVPVADMDLPGEGEEVAGPGVEPATAPTDTAAGSDTCPADGAPVLSGAPAAVPAPVGIGDGAAVTPDEPEPWPTTSKHANGFRAPEVLEELEREDPTVVWVPIRRRGILYHQEREFADRRFTKCGRASRPRGSWMALVDVEALGAVPCPRCYGGSS